MKKNDNDVEIVIVFLIAVLSIILAIWWARLQYFACMDIFNNTLYCIQHAL